MKQTHYYLYAGERYENMKDCTEGIGNGIPSKAFKHMLRLGIVTKVELKSDIQMNAEKLSNDETKRERRV